MQDIRVSIQHMAEAEHLGEFVAAVDQGKKPVNYAFTIFLIGIPIIAFIAIITVALATFLIALYLTIIGTLLAILVLTTIIGYLDARKRTHDQTVVYAGGLVVVKRGVTTVLPWNKIGQVFRGKSITTQRTGKIISDMDTMKIYDYDMHLYRIDANAQQHQRARVCDAVEHGFVEGRLMEIVDRYERGEELLFGTLKLSKRGFDDGREILPWDKFKSISTVLYFVSISEVGRTSDWYQEWLTDMPNVRLLVALVDRVRPPRRS